MGFSSPQALSTDQATDVDTNTVSYALRFADENRSVFSVAGLTPPTEKTLTIFHGVEKNGTKRHGIIVEETLADSLGVVGVGSVTVTFRHPVNSAFTESVMKTISNRAVDFLIEGGTGSNVSALLNGEV